MRTRRYSLRNPFTVPAPGRVAAPPSAPAAAPGRLADPDRVAQPLSMEEPFSLRPRPARALTVSELTRQIQMLLEQAFPAVWVEGEVSEVSYHTSGHLYFTLKDSHNVLKCVAWRQTRERLKFTLETGMQAVCLGRVGLYAKKASLYQLYVEQVEPKGVGALQLAFEQRMDKLKKEGLFEEERKRPLPAFPQRIGIVTSPAGAAIQDILKILKGQVGVVLRPVPVQGEGAAEAIVQGIRDLNSLDGIDLLIVGRGGGSLEDLWAFNEEVVARAIFSSRLPVISAVGHEHNVMISDLVADLRAPTPTKAAEQVLAQRRGTLDRLLTIVEEPAFAQPEEWLEELEEQMGEFEERLLAGSPQTFILQKAQRLQGLREILVSETRRSLEKWEGRVDGLGGRLNALSPLAVLERGYSITFDEKGKIVKAAAELEVGDRMETRLHQGRFTSRVESTQG